MSSGERFNAYLNVYPYKTHNCVVATIYKIKLAVELNIVRLKDEIKILWHTYKIIPGNPFIVVCYFVYTPITDMGNNYNNVHNNIYRLLVV